MLTHVSLLLTGFVVLILGANWLVSGASSLARRLKLSEMMIGLTIVAFGTSTPELVVNLVASHNGQDEVIFGNVIGSNVFNLLLILGVSGTVFPILVQHQTVWREIPFSFITILLLLLFVNVGNYPDLLVLGRGEGALLLALFLIFTIYIIRNIKNSGVPGGKNASRSPVLSILLIIIGLAMLIAGGKLVVDKSTVVATSLGMSEKLIGLTIVSIGTSLPELATSLVAAIRKNSDMAIGNIIGSNIFNILFILGISAVVRPVVYDVSLNQDLMIMGGFTLFVFIAMFTGKRKKLDRWEATILVVSFIGYMIYIVSRN